MSNSGGSGERDELAPNIAGVNAETPTIRPLLSSPTAVSERYSSVDTLRGFALLGILLINIITMALPAMAMINPAFGGGDTGLNLVTWTVNYLLVFQKFLAIFSMLFGAGLILMYTRAEQSSRQFRKIYYRRIRWLMIFGLIHAYFFWWGDILFTYALLGLFLYPLRKLSPKWLISLAVILIVMAGTIYFGFGQIFKHVSASAAEVQAAQEAGETIDGEQEMMREMWKGMRENISPSQEMVNEEIETYRGGYGEIFKIRAIRVLGLQTGGVFMFIGWYTGGMMLLGMGLMKLGVFTAARSRRFYLLMMLFGYGLGLPIIGYSAYRLIGSDFNFLIEFTVSGPLNYTFGVLVTLGHIGAVMLVCKSGALTKIRNRLAAVGRMALTNYLMHTLLLTPFFYGYGLGLFARFGRFELMAFVAATWILQLYLSPLWLKYFHFGPVEWLWRTVTYRVKQPMRSNS